MSERARRWVVVTVRCVDAQCLISRMNKTSVCVYRRRRRRQYSSGWGGWRCQGHISVMKSSPPTRHVRPKKINAEFQLFVNLNSFRIDIQTCATIYTNRSQTPPHRCHIQQHYITRRMQETKASRDKSTRTWEAFNFFNFFFIERRIVCDDLVCNKASSQNTTRLYMYKYTTNEVIRI